jgi:hypothetical protein
VGAIGCSFHREPVTNFQTCQKASDHHFLHYNFEDVTHGTKAYPDCSYHVSEAKLAFNQQTGTDSDSVNQLLCEIMDSTLNVFFTF